MYRAVIIDDERLARKRITGFIVELEDEIKIVGEADTGKLAIELIEKERPELIFLDIQLPDMTGFDILSRISYRPKIIFTTAYQQYAIKAFEELSIDYLVKPITTERFDKAIEKLKALAANESDFSFETLADFVKVIILKTKLRLYLSKKATK